MAPESRAEYMLKLLQLRQLISALLDALASGHDKAASLLFDWGVSPGLGAVAADTPQPGSVHVLILGWGGSSKAQLQPAQKWWQGKGYPTLATTFCPKELQKQLDAISAFLPSDCDVLVHVFSNNGVYLLQELLQQTREGRPWRLSGIILDSAPDACVSPMLMNMVVNGCIRALCRVHGVVLGGRPEAALTAFHVVGPLCVGDRIQDQGPVPSVVDPSGSERGYLANTDRGTWDHMGHTYILKPCAKFRFNAPAYVFRSHHDQNSCEVQTLQV